MDFQLAMTFLCSFLSVCLMREKEITGQQSLDLDCPEAVNAVAEKRFERISDGHDRKSSGWNARGAVTLVEIADLVQNDIRDQTLRANGGRVVEGFAPEVVRVIPEYL